MKGNESVFPDPMRGADQSYSNQDPSEHQAGLTKREYYAAMAMQSLAGRFDLDRVENVAIYAVRVADSLIIELEK